MARVECWTLPREAVALWLKAASPGDVLIYAHGPLIIDAGLAETMNRLAAAREVHLHPRRAECGGLDRIAIRNRVRVVDRRRETRAVLDPAMAALFLRLKACARLGERCPSDAALGRSIGIATARVKYALRKLVAAGLIATRIVPTPSESKYRVARIVESGRETRAPCGAARRDQPSQPTPRAAERRP